VSAGARSTRRGELGRRRRLRFGRRGRGRTRSRPAERPGESRAYIIVAAHVDGNRPDRLAAVAELVEERLQGGAVAARSDPDDPAAVVVGDDGQVAVAAPVRHLVDADPRQPVQAAAVETLGHDAVDDPSDGVPGDPHQPGDRVLGHLLRQEGDDILELAREPWPARPRHRLDAHAAVRALDPPQPGGDEAALATKVQMTPATQHRVVAGAADLPATRAHASPAPQPHRDDHALVGETHAGDRRPGQSERPVECRRGAHVVLLEEPLSFRHPAASPNRRSCASPRAQRPRPRSRAAIPRLSSTLWASPRPLAATQTTGDP
jgi:hypothetical protein